MSQAKRALRRAARQLIATAIGVQDETETIPNVPAQPESAEPADIPQGSSVARPVDNGTVSPVTHVEFEDKELPRSYFVRQGKG